MYKKYLFTSILSFLFVFTFAQQCKIQGKVSDVNGKPLEFVNITLKGEPAGTSSDENGKFSINIPCSTTVILQFSSIGYLQQDKRIEAGANNTAISIVLQNTSEEIEEVNIEDKQVRKTTLTRLNPKFVKSIPEATGNIEALIKTLPGVTSNNELSAQYNVRGGNFDENLVYVNDIQVYRPFLVRSGQQEGMSFINPDMVSSVLFSAGGFEAKYGDKMSSVLDIKYRKPLEFGASLTTSLLGSSGMVQGDSKNHRLTYIAGVRYKTTKYVLNSLETKGDYDPRYLDAQAYITYDISDKLELGILGNISNNSYTFTPQERTTSFGTFNQALQLRMYFEGQEVDQFNTYTGAVSLDYRIHDDLKLKFITSAFKTNESETFDIQGQYWINEVEKDLGSDKLGDSVLNIGIGTYLNHARNSLDAQVYSGEHKGYYTVGNHFLQWGAKYQHEYIRDNITEWKMVDSAGYSIPYTDSVVGMSFYARAKNTLNSNRYSAFVQENYTLPVGFGEFTLSGGIRGQYWDFNKEMIISPRGSISFQPKWERDVVFRLASGYYYQPAFYKEMRDVYGQINTNIKAQKSIHFVAGGDYNFRLWNRPFKLVGEVYYKMLHDLISYSVDNVRIRYSGENDADGYAMGIDMKMNGEFVPGTDSWFSLSVMKTEEDYYNDVQIITDDNGNSVTQYPGYFPRPSDQRVNFGIFFQDYFPGNPDYKMHLQVNFGTGLPYWGPDEPRYKDTLRTSNYKRADIGFSKVIKKASREYPHGHLLHFVKEAWISLEVFNFLDIKNTISHEWVSDFGGRQYAVENSLTGRRVNAKLFIRF
jgi:hypothetical protein